MKYLVIGMGIESQVLDSWVEAVMYLSDVAEAEKAINPSYFLTAPLYAEPTIVKGVRYWLVEDGYQDDPDVLNDQAIYVIEVSA